MKDHSVEGAYWEMAIDGHHDALALLRPLYDESDGGDGFVSLEVSPRPGPRHRGHRRGGPRLHEQIAQPNLLVKVPATAEGVPAIETLIGEGRSINVTLIFGLDRYDEVMEAYLRGLEALAAVRRGRPVRTWPAWPRSSSAGSTPRWTGASRPWPVADGATPPARPAGHGGGGPGPVGLPALPPHLRRPALGGAGAPRAPACSGRCGPPPRPRTRPTPTSLYVDTLIGPDTVNTMPEGTLRAFEDHGTAVAHRGRPRQCR